MGLQQRLNEQIDHLLLEIARRRSINLAQEKMSYSGVIQWRELPFDPVEDEDEYKKWWLPETALVNGVCQVIRPARMSDREKDRYLVHEDKNIITSLGRFQI